MKHIYPIIDLPSVVWFQEGPGVRNNQFTYEGVKLLNVRNLVDNRLVLDNTNTYISEKEAFGKYAHFMVDEGDLIMASSGIKVDYLHKKIAFVEKHHLPLCMNTSTIRFRTLNPNILDISFFKYYLMSSHFAAQVERFITGSAQLNFGPSHLQQMKVILPPINIQRKIVLLLNRGLAAREKRRQANALTEQFLQSVFLEMFGDPVRNPKGWEMRRLTEVCDLITDGKHGDCRNQYNSGYYFISAKDIKNGKIDYSYARQIIKEDFLEVDRRTNLQIGDILITNSGTLGKVAIADDIDKVRRTTFQKSVAIVKYKKDILNSCFLSVLLELSRNHLISSSTGSSQKNLLISDIKKFRVILPPIYEQDKFANIVNKTEGICEKQRYSDYELNILFHSLMQKAFKGELQFNEKELA